MARLANPDLRRFRTVLLVFPHADDEAVTCGGTIRRLADYGAAISLILLTAGERGNPKGVPDPALKEIRAHEARTASVILGISHVIHQDFGDGELHALQHEVNSVLSSKIREVHPDLIITYDAAGLDGHPDHVACSRVVTDVYRAQRPGTLWHTALPPGLLHLLQRIGQMPRDARLDELRSAPTHRIGVAPVIGTKIRAVRAYRSQRQAIGKGLGRLVPPWLGVAMQPFEYFSQLS
jgi:LmbE family N-acetylglucosaminyl deacetylase